MKREHRNTRITEVPATQTSISLVYHVTNDTLIEDRNEGKEMR
jgi:hypothetical protein